MEVTPTQKTALERSDAAFVAPSEDLQLWWNQRNLNVGRYNLNTGYFDLGETGHFTATQVVYAQANYPAMVEYDARMMQYAGGDVVPQLKVGRAAPGSIAGMFQGCNAEVIALHHSNYSLVYATDIRYTFHVCKRLREIVGGILLAANAQITDAFNQCQSLEIIKLKNLTGDISFADSPKLRLDSIAYMVDNAANTTPIVITVHPDVYAKLTDTEGAGALLPANLVELLGTGTSNVRKDGNVFVITKKNIDTYFGIGTVPVTTQAGQKFTLSMDIEGMKDGESCGILLHASGGVTMQFDGELVMHNGRAVGTFTSPKAYSIEKFLIDDTRRNLDYDDTTPIRISNIKLSFGEHEELPYSPALSTIDDADLRERLMWADLVNTAASKNITFATT